MKNFLIAVAVMAALLAGCGKETEQTMWQKIEASHANNNPDSTIMACQTLLKEFPDGKLAPGALYMIAEEYYRGKKDPRTATGYYRSFVVKYPDLVQTPVAMFLLGFIYNNDLRDLDSARAGYTQFLSKYPNHELAASAKFEMENLGRTADQILSEQAPVKPAAPAKKK